MKDSPTSIISPLQLLEERFLPYRNLIDDRITHSIAHMGEKNTLRDACEYALTNGGKRFRPLIVLLVAEALGLDLDVSEAALSVEFFHTASLIADDLPCMDNEEYRRGKRTLHKVYGETVALLASYALITGAFEKIHSNSAYLKKLSSVDSSLSSERCFIALELASKCSGILGATGGQYYDIYAQELNLSLVKDVIYKKTVTLFEVSFCFGWIFGGGALTQVDKVKQLAYHFGMAFQYADDLGDIEQDIENQRSINMARFLGKDKTFQEFTSEMNQVYSYLKELKIYTPAIELLCQALEGLAKVNGGF